MTAPLSSYQQFVYLRTYARYLNKEKRREEWVESVDRYARFMDSRVPDELREDYLSAIESVVVMDTMPSMRALWTAGKALERNNLAGYNCSALTIDRPKAFTELLYLLMCGAGVGFSVERQFISKLPEVPTLMKSAEVLSIADSKEGWAEGFLQYITRLYQGEVCEVDFSKVRPKGSRLKVFGGRASGPEPLQELFKFTLRVFLNAQGRKLNSLECHDICCKTANSVVVGGVRRSACISFSNLSDKRMAGAKLGQFWLDNPQRFLANNSVAYTEKPDAVAFLEEWTNLVKSGAGERGIFNREAAIKSAANGRRDPNHEFVCNPCGEVFLRPRGLCNLSEVVVRETDTLSELSKKVRHATILGCLQATLTKFRFVGSEWKRNAEEERLLGVSLTGTRDHHVLNKVQYSAEYWLKNLKDVATETAQVWSKALGINMPAAITCVKPSGTVSQLVNCSSGIHPRYAEHYIRRVRVSSFDPLAKLMMDRCIPCGPEVGHTMETTPNIVFEFPIKAPETAVTRHHVSALEQCEYWKMFKQYWCDHNPSVTIYCKPDEWVSVGGWVYQNWNDIGGMTFFPEDTGNYQMAPYEEIDSREYEELVNKMPSIDFLELAQYESGDETEGSREMACAGGACDL